MKTSLCVPLTYKHFKWLDNFFASVEKHTEKPDEIVISASNFLDPKKGFEEIVKIAKKYDINTEIKISVTNENLIVGKNRNICIDNAANDLLIFHDADDISHPNRISIIKHLFQKDNALALIVQNYAVNHIVNGFYMVPTWEVYDKTKVILHRFSNAEHYRKTRSHSGVPAVLKSKIGQIRYKEHPNQYIICEDQDFNLEVLDQTQACGYVNEILYDYRLGDNLQGRHG
jgi:glycosyltransferase involved in cell wall biosynthesis